MSAASVPAVRERPILFSGPMVRAILAGEKTQTRRIVDVNHAETVKLKLDEGGWLRTYIGDVSGASETDPDAWAMVQAGFESGMRCKYGRPGDRLWVRETVAIERWTREYGDEPPLPTDRPWKHVPDDGSMDGGDVWYWPHYRATDPAPDLSCERAGCRPCEAGEPSPHWTPSIHMPRWACRIVLEVTDVRVERLQDISQDDAVAEGCDDTRDMDPRPGRVFHADGPRGAYAALWDQINGAGAWAANPWVWAITFRRVAP